MKKALENVQRDQAEPSQVLRIEPQIYYYRACQNVSIGVWVGQATLKAVRGLGDISYEMSRRFPEGHSSIAFILDKVPAPTPDARDTLTKYLQASQTLSCTALILEGSGFWASGIRSMIGNTHRAASSKMRLRVHTTIDEALEWLPSEHLKCTGVELDVVGLRAALIDVHDRGAEEARNA